MPIDPKKVDKGVSNYTAMMLARSRAMAMETLDEATPKLEAANAKYAKLRQQENAGQNVGAELNKTAKQVQALGNKVMSANDSIRALTQVENTRETSTGNYNKDLAKGAAVPLMNPSPSVQKMLKKKGGKK